MESDPHADQTVPEASAPDEAVHAPSARWALARVLGMSLVYWQAITAAVLLGFVLAGSRDLRAWLFQPLLDEIAVPASAGEVDFEMVAPLLSEIGLLAGLTLVASPIAVLGRGYFANWISAQVRTHRWQRTHLPSSLRIAGEDSSIGKF